MGEDAKVDKHVSIGDVVEIEKSSDEGLDEYMENKCNLDRKIFLYRDSGGGPSEIVQLQRELQFKVK